MRSWFLKVLIGCCAGILVSACGVKSSPVAPDGSTYPAQYPKPLPPLEVIEEAPAAKQKTSPVIADPKSFWQYPNTPPTK